MADRSRTSGDESAAERRSEIQRIRRAIGEAEARGGRSAPVPRTQEDRFRKLISQRSTRLASLLYQMEHARSEAERIETEANTLMDEISGYEKGLRALLGGVLQQADDWAAPHWSPIPIHGYRMWVRREGRLHGARTAWDGPSMEARCLGGSHPVQTVTGVPHTGGECGSPPCGIYAMSDLDGMLTGLALPGRVLGLVALSGKVVEHEHGYRAGAARVVAMAMLVDGTLRLGSGPAWVADLFGGVHPDAAMGSAISIPIRPRSDAAVRGFFQTERARYLEQWTSANRSA